MNLHAAERRQRKTRRRRGCSPSTAATLTLLDMRLMKGYNAAMKDDVQHKGLIISANPMPLREGEGQWSLSIQIERHTGSQIHTREFCQSNQECEDREEAVRRCHAFGAAVIDGKVPGCTVEGL